MSVNIEQKIREIIKGCLENNPEEILKVGYEEELINYGVNSIVFIKVVIGIETEFGFEFDEEAIDGYRFSNIKSIVEYVKSKI